MNLNRWRALSLVCGLLGGKLFVALAALVFAGEAKGPPLTLGIGTALMLSMMALAPFAVVQMTARLEERMDMHFLRMTAAVGATPLDPREDTSGGFLSLTAGGPRRWRR